jgi:hypothetical protein
MLINANFNLGHEEGMQSLLNIDSAEDAIHPELQQTDEASGKLPKSQGGSGIK